MKIDKASIGIPASRQRFDLFVRWLLFEREEPLEILLGAHIIAWKDLDPAYPS